MHKKQKLATMAKSFSFKRLIGENERAATTAGVATK